MILNPGRSRKGCPNKSADERHYPGLTDNMHVCNCSECGVLLLSRRHHGYVMLMGAKERDRLPEMIAGTKDGRPVCLRCTSNYSPPEPASCHESAPVRFKSLEVEDDERN